jgi:hypothetical protein
MTYKLVRQYGNKLMLKCDVKLVRRFEARERAGAMPTGWQSRQLFSNHSQISAETQGNIARKLFCSMKSSTDI